MMIIHERCLHKLVITSSLSITHTHTHTHTYTILLAFLLSYHHTSGESLLPPTRRGVDVDAAAVDREFAVDCLLSEERRRTTLRSLLVVTLCRATSLL